MLNITMPKRSILQCGLAAVISALMMSWLHIRPLGIFFLSVFCLWFYKTRCNLRIVAPPELQKKYEQIRAWISAIRQNNPTMFCSFASSCLALLALIGHCVSGSTVVLVGLVLAAIVSTKYNFKLIKIEPKDFAWSEKLNSELDHDIEYLPEINEKNRYLLEFASRMAIKITPPEEFEDEEDKSDEVPSELLITDVLPDIDENSEDEEVEELAPIDQNEHNQNIENNTATTPPTSTTSQADIMKFKKGHFKRDSSLSTTSSSSEESLSKGLQFPDHTTVDGPSRANNSGATTLRQITDKPAHNQEASDNVALAQTQALFAHTTKLLPNLVSGLMQWGLGGGNDIANEPLVAPGNIPTTQSQERRVANVLESSDESDFEILEDEDFK